MSVNAPAVCSAMAPAKSVSTFFAPMRKFVTRPAMGPPRSVALLTPDRAPMDKLVPANGTAVLVWFGVKYVFVFVPRFKMALAKPL